MAQNMRAWANFFSGHYDVFTRIDRKAQWQPKSGSLNLVFEPNGHATEILFPSAGGAGCLKVMITGNWPIREAYFHLLTDAVTHRLGLPHITQASMGSGTKLDGGALVGFHTVGDFFVHLGFFECDDNGGGTPLGSGVLATNHAQGVAGKIKFEGGEYALRNGKAEKLMEVQLRSRDRHTRPDTSYPWNV